MFWALTAKLGFQHLQIVPCRLTSCMRVLENWVQISGSQTYEVGSELKVSIDELFSIGWVQGIYFDLPCQLPLLASCSPRQVSHDPPLRWPAFCNAHGRHLRHPYICTCSSKWKWELAAGRLQRFVVS